MMTLAFKFDKDYVYIRIKKFIKKWEAVSFVNYSVEREVSYSTSYSMMVNIFKSNICCDIRRKTLISSINEKYFTHAHANNYSFLYEILLL